jgi:GNAT superfamily N-acetyltransferase
MDIADMLIERALVRDAEDILKLQYLCFQREAELYNDYTLPPLKQTLAGLLLEYDTHIILVARYRGEVVGSVRANLKEGSCYVGRLIVHPRIQRQGIGSRLLQAVEREFPDISRYELFTGSRSEANVRLYASCGYRPSRTEKLSPGVEIVFMEKLQSNLNL